MTKLIKFDENLFRFIDLKGTFSLANAIEKAIDSPSPHVNQYNYYVVIGFEGKYKNFIDKVVATVKEVHFTTTNKTCSISLEVDDQNLKHSSHIIPPSPDLCTSHLIIVAQALYRSFGIKIKQVDTISSPRKMIVTWHRDHPMLNPPSPYTVKSRKEGFLTDCTLKFGDKLFPAHRIVLAAKSPYFERLFKSGCQDAAHGAVIPVIIEGLEERSIEILLDYFYKGELNLEGNSLMQIDNLVNFSSYLVLPHLKQMCFEYLCKNVNAANLQSFLALARHYEYKELEFALVKHLEKEITLDNFEQLMQLRETEKIEGFLIGCMESISKCIQKIDYEPSGFEKSARLKDFIKSFDLAFKYKSAQMVYTIVTQMRKVLSHPGYGTCLEKLIEYLALTCEYQSYLDMQSVSQLDWLPKSVNDIQAIKNELCEKVLNAVRFTGYDLKRPLIEECLEVAEKYQLGEIKAIFIQELTKEVLKNPNKSSKDK